MAYEWHEYKTKNINALVHVEIIWWMLLQKVAEEITGWRLKDGSLWKTTLKISLALIICPCVWYILKFSIKF